MVRELEFRGLSMEIPSADTTSLLISLLEKAETSGLSCVDEGIVSDVEALCAQRAFEELPGVAASRYAYSLDKSSASCGKH